MRNIVAAGVEHRSKEVEESPETSEGDIDPTQQRPISTDEEEEKDAEDEGEGEEGVACTQPQKDLRPRRLFGNKSPKPAAQPQWLNVIQAPAQPSSSQVHFLIDVVSFFLYKKY